MSNQDNQNLSQKDASPTVDELRNKITELKKELTQTTLEKGLSAEDNKDLRENFAYDYWDQKERILLNRIHALMAEIKQRTQTKKPVKKTSRETQAEKNTLPKQKWL